MPRWGIQIAALGCREAQPQHLGISSAFENFTTSPLSNLLRLVLRTQARSAGLSLERIRSSLSGMSATLTVNLDADVLRLAEQEAKARHTTLPEVVAQQLRVMARNWQESNAGKTPVTDALRGAVKLPSDCDERAALTDELQKKHGVQG